jgi:transcriptional regulator with XRE-family HTH domain
MVSVEARQRFARNLRDHRVRLGLSQEALGDACDLHRTEISLLERARRDPRLSTILRLSQALGISASKLLDGVR